MKAGLAILGLLIIGVFIYFCYQMAGLVIMVLPILQGKEFVLTIAMIMLFGSLFQGKGE